MEPQLRLISPLERALFLKTLAPMQSLSSDDLALLALKARERHFRKGALLFAASARVPSVHVVTQGRVRTRTPFGDLEFDAGQPVGLLALLARSEGFDAEALSETNTLEIQADDLFDLLEDHFDILLAQIRETARRILEERRHIPDGTYLAPAEGLAVPASDELDLVERLLFMRRGGTFQQSNMDALIQLARSLEERRLGAGITLWRSGEPSGSILLLVSGTVRCTLEDGTHFRAGPGYPLGNLESLCGAPRWYTAVTDSPVFGMRLATEPFTDVLEDHFEMALDYLAALARNLIGIFRERSERQEGDTRAA